MYLFTQLWTAKGTVESLSSCNTFHSQRGIFKKERVKAWWKIYPNLLIRHFVVFAIVINIVLIPSWNRPSVTLKCQAFEILTGKRRVIDGKTLLYTVCPSEKVTEFISNLKQHMSYVGTYFSRTLEYTRNSFRWFPSFCDVKKTTEVKLRPDSLNTAKKRKNKI